MELLRTLDYNSSVTGIESNVTMKLVVAYWEQVFTAVLIGLIAIVGIVGNAMIIVAVAFSQKLQTSTNVFVTSLSIADLLTSVFLIFHTIGGLGKNGWLIPDAYWLCKLTAFVTYAGIGTSMYSLGTIAVNRLILITKPFLYNKIFTSWKLAILVAVAWIVPGGSITILLLTGVGELGYDDIDLTCSVLDSHEYEPIFSLVVTLIGFPLPLLVITVSYFWIYIHLKKHFRAKKQNLASNSINASSCSAAGSVSVTLSTSCSGTDSENVQDIPLSKVPRQQEPSHIVNLSVHQRKEISRQQIEITKNLFLVVCGFLLCFLPYFILIFVPDSNNILFYTRVITLSNSSINFAIYARKHPNFKVVFGHLMRCSYADIPQPSRLLRFLLSKEN